MTITQFQDVSTDDQNLTNSTLRIHQVWGWDLFVGWMGTHMCAYVCRIWH